MSGEAPRVLLAGGGTGGHLFPAIAIADEIRQQRPGAVVLFVGTKDKIEARVVPQRGDMFSAIWISGFHRSLRLSNLLFPVKVLVSLVQSIFLIRRFRPDVVIGTGGYVCGPVLSVAARMGVPVVVHESNSVPGVTTRMLSRRANAVFTAFDVTAAWLPRKDNVQTVGTPVRKSLGTRTREEGSRTFGLDPGKRTVLVFGGSLGAASINAAVEQALIPAAVDIGFQIIWQTGRTLAVPAERMQGTGWVGPFIDAMEDAYAAADLVVCRAGAATLAELTRLGKPAILVPFPHAAADHQTMNARVLADAGAALLMPDAAAERGLATEIVRLLSHPARLADMHAAGLRLGKPDAAEKIARWVLAMVR